MPASTSTPSNPNTPSRRLVRWPQWAADFIVLHYGQKGDQEIGQLLNEDSRVDRFFTTKMVEKKRLNLGKKRTPEQLTAITRRHYFAGTYQRAESYVPAHTLPEGHISEWNEKDPEGSSRPSMRIKVNGEMVRLSTHTWEQAYGPVPTGHIVTFRDGNPRNCELTNLLVMSRADNIARNRNFLKERENQRQTHEARRIEQRLKFEELSRQLAAVDKRLADINEGKEDERYTVDFIAQVKKELNLRRNGLLVEIYKLPESAKKPESTE